MAAITNLGTDMSPLANPLTSGRVSNTIGLNNGFSRPKDLSKLSLPDSEISYFDALAAQAEMQSAMHVPETASLPRASDMKVTSSQQSQEYWNYAQKKTSELLKNMTDEQKSMLADIDNIVGKSKLELEENTSIQKRKTT